MVLHEGCEVRVDQSHQHRELGKLSKAVHRIQLQKQSVSREDHKLVALLLS